MADVPFSTFVAALALDTVGGSEKLPVVDGSTPGHITPDMLVTYVIAQLVVASVATPTSGDELHGDRSGTAKVFTLNAVSDYAVARGWTQAAEADPATSADKLLIDRSGTKYQLDIDTLAIYVNAAVLNLTALDAAAPGASDLFLFGSGATPKKITLANLEAKFWTDLATYVGGLSAVATTSATDKFYCLQGGTAKYVTPTELATYINPSSGDVTGPVASTENNVPQWDSTNRKLKDGVSLVTTVRADGDATDTAMPTEAAVRDAIEAGGWDGDIADINLDGGIDIGAALADADLILVDDGAGGTNRKCAMSRVKTYLASTGSFAIAALDIDGGADIGGDLADVDLIVVDDGAGGTNRKSAISRVWTYITGKIQALTAKTTPVDADILIIQDSAASDALKELTVGSLWDNRYLADAQAIKLDDFAAPDDNTDLNSTTLKHGLLPKLGGGAVNFLRADGTWAEPGVAVGWDGDIADIDIDGGVDIGGNLVDADLIVVDDGAGGTNRKCAVSRMWTYIWSKVTGASDKSTGADADSLALVDSEDGNAVKKFTLASAWSYIQTKMNAVSGKTTGVDADIAWIQDSAASFVIKEFTLANLFAYVQTKLIAVAAKTTAVNADRMLIEDSAASNAVKFITVTNLWTNRYLLDTKALRLEEFAAATDVTTLNVSTSAHGLCPKLPNNTRQFLRGDGNYTTYASVTAAPVAAAGSTNSDAAALGTSNTTYITSDSAAKGAKLPTGAAGDIMEVINTSGTAAKLYPATGGTLNGLTANAAVVIPASKGVRCFCSAADTWTVFDMTALATTA